MRKLRRVQQLGVAAMALLICMTSATAQNKKVLKTGNNTPVFTHFTYTGTDAVYDHNPLKEGLMNRVSRTSTLASEYVEQLFDPRCFASAEHILIGV